MKVVVLGGPKDGQEMDVPPGTAEWRFPVSRPTNVIDVTSSDPNPAPMAVKVYRAGKIRSADGTRMKAVLVEPGLWAWMEKK